jgi:restriction system protein
MAVRQLQGVMHQYDADHGLFVAWRGVAWRGVAWRGVAWRGFKSTVVRPSSFPASLWSGEDLLDFVLEHYDELGPEIYSDLPLKRVRILSLADELFKEACYAPRRRRVRCHGRLTT